MKRSITIIISALLALALAAGCSSGKGEASSITQAYDAGFSYTEEAVSNDVAYDMPAEAPAAGAEGSTSAVSTADVFRAAENNYGGRKVISTYSLSLETDEFDAQMQALKTRVSELGGYVENSNVEGRKPETYNESGRSGYFTFRIPADKAAQFAEDAKSYGTVTSYSENAEDITSQYFDLDTRLSVLRTQLDRLTSILVKTDNLADVIALEQEIANVTLEIEELTTELRRYDGLVDYATVNVNLYERRLITGPAAEKTVGERMGEGFTDSLYGVGTFFVNAFVWLVGALPVLVVLGGIGVAVFFIIRGGKKRQAKREALREKRAAEYMAKRAAAQGVYNTNGKPMNATGNNPEVR